MRIAPQEALDSAGVYEFPQKFWLEMSGTEPVYRMVDWRGSDLAVSAADGQLISRAEPYEALQTVQLNLSAPQATLLKADLVSDQWTVTGYWNELRPFHVVALNDPADTHYYVSVDTGEIVLDTAYWERFWNYLGAIPHWMYFEFIRADTDTWFWVVIVLSAIGIFGAFSGLWIGITRLRLRNRYGGTRVTPFLGWMKWHHVAGIIGGVFVFTWIVTGLLSMYPGGFLEQRPVTAFELKNYAGQVDPEFSFTGKNVVAAGEHRARSAEFKWVGGRSLVVLRDGESKATIVDSTTGMEEVVPDDDYYEYAEELMPEATIVATERLTVGDEYWHSAYRIRKLPILRVAFDDKADTWFYIDPDSGEVAGILDNIGRLDRWFNMGVHDIDLAYLHKHRPLWDIVVWILMLAGLFISSSGMVIGVKRLMFDAEQRRKRRRIEARLQVNTGQQAAID